MPQTWTISGATQVVTRGEPNTLSFFGLPDTTKGYGLLLAGPTTNIFGTAGVDCSKLPAKANLAGYFDTSGIEQRVVFLNSTSITAPKGNGLIVGANHETPTVMLCPAILTGWLPDSAIVGWSNLAGTTSVTQGPLAVAVIDVPIFQAAVSSASAPATSTATTATSNYASVQNTVTANQNALAAATSTGTAMQTALNAQIDNDLEVQQTADTIAQSTAAASAPMDNKMLILAALAIIVAVAWGQSK